MPSAGRARIGIIGTGWWATYAHLPSLSAYAKADVVAIADPSEDRLAQAAERFGIAHQFTDYREMLEKADLDGVIVATPHATHFEIARDVLQAGRALMLEKPMVLKASHARQLQTLANENNTHFVIGYPYHFVEQHQQLRDRIKNGALGNLQLVHSLFASMVLEYYRANPQAYAPVFQWQVTGPQPNTYSDPTVAGGGQGHLQVTHSAALLLWLTDLQPHEVAAFLEGFDLNVDLCDAISVRFDNAAVGTFASTGGIPTTQTGHQQLEIRLYGSDGYAWLDPVGGTCSIYSNDGSVERLDDTPPDRRYPMDTTSRHLVDLILGDATTNQSPAEIGARTVELLEAAYRSAAERRIVSVAELHR